jgi:hypothetical protein
MIVIDKKSGREIEIFTAAKGNTEEYTGVEVTRNGQWVAEIGCWFDGRTLVDYDGVFEIAQDVCRALRKAGYIVPIKDFS